MKEHNLQTHDNQRYSTQENTMQKHKEESNANNLEQNNIMQNHGEESNANQNKFVQGKSDGRGEKINK